MSLTRGRAGSIEKLQSFAALHDFSLLEAGQNVDLSSLKVKPLWKLSKLSLADFNQMIPYLWDGSTRSFGEDGLYKPIDGKTI